MPAILLQIVLTPLVASVLIYVTRKGIPRAAGIISCLSLLYSLFLIGLAAVSVMNGGRLEEEYLLVQPGITVGLLADGLSLPTLAVINILCVALSFYALHYIRHRIEVLYEYEPRAVQDAYFAKFYYLFLLFPVGFFGVTLSTNLIAMYFFLEVLTITLYFLMAWFGYRDRVRVAFICLAWGLVSALFVMTGAVIAYTKTGSFEIASLVKLSGTDTATVVIALFLVGLLAKLAIFPFHVWMPWVHAEHPTCIAGLLAVYANLALYILVRTVVGPMFDDFKPFGPPLMVLALVTMIYGSLLTMAQTDVKRLAACSTISQIAYSVLGLGAMTVVSIEGGMFFFLSHIMGKTLFFSTAGIIVYTTGIRDMNQMGGLARKMPATAVLWTFGAMMLSGFPPFSSFTAEWIMFTGIFEQGVMSAPWGIAIAIGGVMAILLTVGYTFAGLRKIFFGPLPEHLKDKDLKDPPLTMSIPLYLVAAGSICLGLYPKIIMDLLHAVIGG
jgi:formate hydrogenlyase subunit 3/multisubunit Na+/H+ antiporter MnhD subunit